jgi:hypothetical protein
MSRKGRGNDGRLMFLALAWIATNYILILELISKTSFNTPVVSTACSANQDLRVAVFGKLGCSEIAGRRAAYNSELCVDATVLPALTN